MKRNIKKSSNNIKRNTEKTLNSNKRNNEKKAQIIFKGTPRKMLKQY